MIANSYPARYGNRLLRGAEVAAHSRRCTAVLKTAAAYRLERPTSLPLLPSAARRVEERFTAGAEDPDWNAGAADIAACRDAPATAHGARDKRDALAMQHAR